ncbi:hypothetical protein PIROE2DRAFT_16694, partial [Piromyces sp. E2]
MTINLKISLENNVDNIVIENNELKFIIRECKSEQIKMFIKKTQFYYCENPICDEYCPIYNETAVCVKGNTENMNVAELNHCECVSGWKGNKCQDKDFVVI